jgi:O-antigen/teichoic acid export membrane protein
LRQGATLFLSNSLGQALAFLTSIAVGRLLGVHSFGQYATVMALVFVLGVFAEMGMETHLTREVARSPARSRELLLASLLAKSMLGGVLALALALPALAGLLAPDRSSVPAVQVAGLLLVLNAYNASFSAVFRAWGRMGYVLAINVSGLSLQLAGAIPVLVAFRSVPALMVWLVVVQVYELALGWWLFRKSERMYGTGALHPRLRYLAADLLRRSLPFTLAGVVGALTLRIDLFLIEALRGVSSAGVYGVALRLADLLVLAPNSLYAALLPALAVAHNGGSVGTTYREAVRAMALVGLVATLLGLLLADLFVWFSFGEDFRAAAHPLQVLSLMLPALLVNRTTTVQLYASYREAHANVGLVLNLGVRVAMGLMLVGAWGAPGAALAAVSGECALLCFYYLTGAMRAESTQR